MKGAVDRALLYARTVFRLRPEQVAHRARLRTQRFVLGRLPDSAVESLRPRGVSAQGWPSDFVALDSELPPECPTPHDNAGGRFTFLGEQRTLGVPADWEQHRAAQLWRYHLHYLEWAWSFAAHPDRTWATKAFTELWHSWRDGIRPGRGDAWSPYVVSLRAWALCGVFAPLIEGTAAEQEFIDDLALHARFLRAHLELDVGGNHLIKNLKALAGVGVFLGDDGLADVARRRLAREIKTQVLADGGHFERSPSYHCQVLGDLIDVSRLFTAANQQPVPGLGSAVDSMRQWLGAMLMPDGDVPLFNDCVLVGRERLVLLVPAEPPSDRLMVLEPSGYVVVRAQPKLHLVADVGPPCPRSLPAHAHADCLSFELAVDGRRVIVDTGTSTYQPGPRRAHERSTAAHNTVQIDGADQTEVWGTFRAARRANATLEKAGDADGTVEVVASHDGYGRLPGSPHHRRAWRVTGGAAGERVEIVDEVTGHGTHRLEWRLHFAPGCQPILTDEQSATAGPVSVSILGPRRLTVTIDTAEVATRFGRRNTTHVLVARAEAQLPAVIQSVITAKPGRQT